MQHQGEFLSEFYKHSGTTQLPALTIHKHFDHPNDDEGELFSSVPNPIAIVSHPDQIQVDETIKEYLKSLTFSEQFKRDSQSIVTFLSAKDINDPTYAKKQTILRRLLIAINESEFVDVLTKNKHKQNEIKIPLGSILLHGASFKFDLPYLKKGEDPNDFFYALIGGKDSHTAMNKLPLLALSEHQYYGMNLGLGENNKPLAANGHHGHLYMHWIPPSNAQEGHLMIRIYSAESNKKNRFNELDSHEHPNQFSATGGMRFSSSEKYSDIDQFHTLLSSDQIIKLINIFKNNLPLDLLTIDQEIKNQTLINVHLIQSKKITEEILEHFTNEINIYIDKINDLFLDEIIEKDKIIILNTYISHCKEIKKQLEKYNNENNEKLDYIKEKLNELIYQTYGKIADYIVENHTIDNNTIHRISQSHYSDNIILTEEIQITHTSLISKLTRDALNQLTTLKENLSYELISLNESIKWVEEAIFCYRLKNHHFETRLILENYHLLEKEFYNNIINYCQLKGYHLTLNPLPKISSFNQENKEKFNHLYQQYEKILYQLDKNDTLDQNIQEAGIPTLTISS